MSAPPSSPLLFEKYPDLAERIGYINLGTAPTPVQRLTNLGHDNLWIKRDDRISPFYGGNKVRRLEFVLADAMQKHKKRIVTIGGIGTNHGLATAIFCRKLGIACTLVLFDQTVTRYVRHNLLLFHRYGAEMIYRQSIFEAGLHYYLMQRLRYPQAYFLPAGGSSPLGTLGAVNAVFEFLQQMEAGAMPPPAYVFCPTASNGTLAGLCLGFALAGFETTVIGVRVGVARVGPLQFNTPAKAAALMKTIYDLLKRNAKGIPPIQIKRPVMLDNYCGEAYGMLTDKGLAAVELFKTRADIILEPVYTGKTCAALLDFIRDPAHTDETILYWHTFNSVDLSREAQTVDYHTLPKEFHCFFETRNA